MIFARVAAIVLGYVTTGAVSTLIVYAAFTLSDPYDDGSIWFARAILIGFAGAIFVGALWLLPELDKLARRK